MRLITEKPIIEFCARQPVAEAPLRHWVEVASPLNWKNFGELRATFPHADKLNDCVIFSIGGNRFRLIAWIHYARMLEDGRWSTGRLYVRHILTHAEYDRGDWKADCT